MCRGVITFFLRAWGDFPVSEAGGVFPHSGGGGIVITGGGGGKYPCVRGIILGIP